MSRLRCSLLDDLRRTGLTLGPRLGSGATSAVYAVSREQDLPGAETLALKLLHAEYAGHLELVLRFLNEQRAAVRVQHPAVVRVYGSGLVADRPYLVLPRLEGTLAQRAAALAPAQRLGVAAQVAAGAAALHRAGVVHRDLKPANIMFAPGPGRAARIVDLGLAKLSAGPDLPVSTAATQVLGTAEYRAPELWMSAKDADGHADVYSLGVMLYELLAGRLPFDAERESLLMDLHLFAPPPPLPGLPAGIAALLGRMLAKQRAQRPDMTQVAEALRAAAG